MAFDGKTNDARLNREILVRELRENPPADWDYRLVRKCGLGVAHRLGLMPASPDDPTKWDCSALLRNIGLSAGDAAGIFFYPFGYPSPNQVANMLEVAQYV